MDVNHPDLPALCERFHVRRLDLFGSAADGRFDPDRSDLDFLVTFDRESDPSPFRTYFGLLEALADLYGRKVDLLEESAIKNPYLRRAVERQRRQVYPAS